ncbi:MAG: acetolactate synthase 2 catalytic subunit [Alphaproteobacteria bacterium]
MSSGSISAHRTPGAQQEPEAPVAAPAPGPSAAPSNRISGARLLIQALEDQGVDVIFGYPGGAIMPVYDALVGSNLRHILSRHEQGSALAADGYARVSGRPGVCLATSGPGATNLVTGIANAFLDSVPLIAITGQVATPLMGTDAFQEVDIFGITLPIVKHSFIVREAEDIPRVVADAFAIATSGRPGPVLIDLPKDIANTLVATPNAAGPQDAQAPAIDEAEITAANTLIASAERPILYVGGGIGIARAEAQLRALTERSGIPVVATLKGLGAVPTDHANFLGMLGMHGLKGANLAVQDCDLLICCGARFDDRATGKLDTFAPLARVIHIDADRAEISKLRDADVGITGRLGDVLDRLAPEAPSITPWQMRTSKDRDDHAWRYDAPGTGIYAPALLKAMSEKAGDAFVATCDVGQHQMWVAQHCRFSRPQAHLTSGGLGTMGYGVPAGIGAKLAEPEACVVTVTGDGSIMMNIQELATLKRYGIALKICLLDNAALGMVRQWQELFFEGNYSEVDLSDNPDFVQVANAFGIEAFAISEREEVEGGIERLLNTDGPVLMHVKIDPKENVWPLVPPGQSNASMMEG